MQPKPVGDAFCNLWLVCCGGVQVVQGQALGGELVGGELVDCL